MCMHIVFTKDHVAGGYSHVFSQKIILIILTQRDAHINHPNPKRCCYVSEFHSKKIFCK